MKTLKLKTEQETIELGKLIAKHSEIFLKHQSDKCIIIYLRGDLGAGKTTFSRGFLQQLGHNGNVKSPTYTLVEPYAFDLFSVYHFDLYRLAAPEELEFIGIRDYISSSCICLIEWPEKVKGFLPSADIEIVLLYDDLQRVANITCLSNIGKQVIDIN